jgi:hypothetical protein
MGHPLTPVEKRDESLQKLEESRRGPIFIENGFIRKSGAR